MRASSPPLLGDDPLPFFSGSPGMRRFVNMLRVAPASPLELGDAGKLRRSFGYQAPIFGN